MMQLIKSYLHFTSCDFLLGNWWLRIYIVAAIEYYCFIITLPCHTLYYLVFLVVVPSLWPKDFWKHKSPWGRKFSRTLERMLIRFQKFNLLSSLDVDVFRRITCKTEILINQLILTFLHKPQECNLLIEETMTQMFSSEFCKIFKNTYFVTQTWC